MIHQFILWWIESPKDSLNRNALHSLLYFPQSLSLYLSRTRLIEYELKETVKKRHREFGNPVRDPMWIFYIWGLTTQAKGFTNHSKSLYKEDDQEMIQEQYSQEWSSSSLWFCNNLLSLSSIQLSLDCWLLLSSSIYKEDRYTWIISRLQ